MALPALPLLSIQRLREGCSPGADGLGGQPLRFAIRRSDASNLSLQDSLSIDVELFAGALGPAIELPVLEDLSFAPGQDSITIEIPLLAGATPMPGTSLLIWLPPQSGVQLLAGGQSASGGFDSQELLSSPLPLPSPWKSDRETINPHAFAALRADGSVIAWGDPELGGDSSAVDAQLGSGVVQIFSTNAAFAALRSDGSVVAWGDAESGANTTSVAADLLADVVTISSTEAAFAALKADGSVICWGDEHYGGRSTGASDQLRNGVTALRANERAFAALKADGSVVTWGDSAYGGNSMPIAADLAGGVVAIASTASAFAALKSDGSVVAWGDSVWGGDSQDQADALGEGVVQLFANGTAFAALKVDGSVITWGDGITGGDSSAIAPDLVGVDRIASNDVAFAALRIDGSVVCWGDPAAGGDCSDVAEDLGDGVIAVVGTERAFAALKADGSVICWGDLLAGGEPLLGLGLDAGQLDAGVVALSATAGGFAALKSDGSVLCWGHPLYGGAASSPVGNALDSGVLKVVSNGSAFAAIKADGSVVCWGDPLNGGLGPLEALVPGSDLWRVPVLSLADPFSDERLDRLPTALSLSRSQVLERIATGATVALLDGLDPDPGDRLTYSLVAGAGDRDNSLFVINGQRLQVLASPDYETQTSALIRVAATDRWGRTLEREIVLTLRDAPAEERIRVQGSSDAHEVLLEDLTALDLQDPAGVLPAGDLEAIAEVGIRVVLDRPPLDLRDGLRVRLPWELMALGLRTQGSDGLILAPSERAVVLAFDPTRGSRVALRQDPAGTPGARILDADGDGNPDAIVLTLSDGGATDRDGSADGHLDSGVVLGTRTGVNPALEIQGNGLTISGAAGGPAVPVLLRARVNQRAKGVAHLGMVVLDAGETLADLNPTELARRSRRLISSLAARDGLAVGGSTGECTISLMSDQTLLILEEADGAGLTSNGATANPTWLNLRAGPMDPGAGTGLQQAWATGSNGLELELNLLATPYLGLRDLVAAEQGRAPLLDFTALGDQPLTLNVRVLRDAALDTTAGFYRILDRDGAVRDPISGAILRPGDGGYGAAALASALRGGPLDGLRTAQGQVSQRQGTLQEESLLAPYAQVAGDGTYFGFAAANPDGIQHLLMLGSNVFGFEDLRGGGDRDFNDLVISIAFQPQPLG